MHACSYQKARFARAALLKRHTRTHKKKKRGSKYRRGFTQSSTDNTSEFQLKCIVLRKERSELPLCGRVLRRRRGAAESMSERPRAPLFTAKPDDVFVRRLCSWAETTAPPRVQRHLEVITPPGGA